LTMKMRCGHGKGGHGPLSQINKSATLTTRQEQLLIQPVTGTLCAGDSAGVSNQYVRQGKCIITPNLQLRRLTPLEYERLQGFPDYWTLIEPSKIGNRRVAGSDCARYKALGNSIRPDRYTKIRCSIAPKGAPSARFLKFPQNL
jgi:site-specific DNA-cytosine methylase